MKVFISWSGADSRAIAEQFKEWLPVIINALEPFYSPKDIAKGTRWSRELASQLEGTHSGILCLTPENIAEPWLHFEAGALSKMMSEAKVTPVLFGVEPSELPGPLKQFQAAVFQKADILALIKSLNQDLGEGRVPEGTLAKSFRTWWPEFEKAIRGVWGEGALPEPKPEKIKKEVLDADLESVGEGISMPALLHMVYSYCDLVDYLNKKSDDREVWDLLADLHRPINHLSRRHRLSVYGSESRLEKARDRIDRNCAKG